MSKITKSLSIFIILFITYSVYAGGPASLVVINEVDYDQPGTDTAEFIELYNPSLTAISLNSYKIELLNGADGTLYATIILPNVMIPGQGYYVLCQNMATVPNCDMLLGSSVQNGAPDAIGLRDFANIVLDSLSYEGSNANTASFTEGTGAGTDSGSTGMDNLGLSRFPNGTDTNNNSADFRFIAITPGAANLPLLSINDVTQLEGNTGTTTFNFTVSLSIAANVTVQVNSADGTAFAGTDYTAITAQTITFTAAGPTTQMVAVTVNGDVAVEADETFTLNLINPMGASILD